MTQLFRKIRQRLLTENKFTKYLIYAIGEIILVVIGILIALQVNNWNEQNKTEREQLVFLKNLKSDLHSDLLQLDNILSFQTEKLKVVNTLQDELVFEKDFPEIQRLFTEIAYTSNDTFFPNTGTYSTAVSSGKIANLTPDELKIAITNLYERYYYRLVYNGEVYDKRYDEVSLRRGKFFNKVTRKLNSPEVIEESEFANLVTIVLYDNNTYVKLGTATREEIIKVLDLLEARLNE